MRWEVLPGQTENVVTVCKPVPGEWLGGLPETSSTYGEKLEASQSRRMSDSMKRMSRKELQGKEKGTSPSNPLLFNTTADAPKTRPVL